MEGQPFQESGRAKVGFLEVEGHVHSFPDLQCVANYAFALHLGGATTSQSSKYMRIWMSVRARPAQLVAAASWHYFQAEPKDCELERAFSQVEGEE